MSIVWIGLILAGIYLLAKKAGRIRFKKMSYWVVGIYSAVILISSAAAPLFLDERSLANAENKTLMDFDRVYETLIRGGIGELDDQYVLAHTRFEHFDEAVLTLAVSDPDTWAPIFVERKKENDGLVEGFIVGQPVTVYGYVIPETTKPIELKLEGSTLAIETMYQVLNISAARDSFPVRQLTGDTLMDDISVIDQMIYLKIPAGVNVETENESVYFNYTEE